MNKLGSRLNLSMESAVFMDKPRLRSELSMESGVFMDKRTDGVFEATCHPRLGGASEGGGGRRNTPSVRFMYRDLQRVILPQRSKDFLHQTCSLRRRCI